MNKKIVDDFQKEYDLFLKRLKDFNCALENGKVVFIEDIFVISVDGYITDFDDEVRYISGDIRLSDEDAKFLLDNIQDVNKIPIDAGDEVYDNISKCMKLMREYLMVKSDLFEADLFEEMYCISGDGFYNVDDNTRTDSYLRFIDKTKRNTREVAITIHKIKLDKFNNIKIK